jgi:N-acetylneuraminate epimerase
LIRYILIIQIIIVFNFEINAQSVSSMKGWEALDVSTISDLPSIGLAGQSAAIHRDKLFVLGGSNFPDAMPWEGGQKKYFDKIWIYQLGDKIQETKQPTSVKYPHPIAYATAILHKDEWIIVGGETPEGRTAEVKIMDFSKINELSWKSLPSLPIPLSNANAFIINDELHIAGGETGSITSASHYILNLSDRSKGWKLLEPLPYQVSHGVLLHDKQNKRFLLLGGRAKIKDGPSVFYQSSLSFDLSTNQWKEAEALPYPLAAGTGITMLNGTMLIFGGDQGVIFNKVEECLIKVAQSKNPDDIESWNKIRKGLQSTHPGFSRTVIMWDVKQAAWVESERLPFATPVTTQSVCNEQYLVIPGGEIRAGVRTANFYIKKIKA